MDCDEKASEMSIEEYLGSNPFPFLLWIATTLIQRRLSLPRLVVTLFHFYCGLRQLVLRKGVVSGFSSNPFPFLLWIATDP